MNDNVSFLVEHGLPLEEIQSLLADGHSMEEIVTNARRMMDRGNPFPLGSRRSQRSGSALKVSRPPSRSWVSP